jgi:hypothetical protein
MYDYELFLLVSVFFCIQLHARNGVVEDTIGQSVLHIPVRALPLFFLLLMMPLLFFAYFFLCLGNRKKEGRIVIFGARKIRYITMDAAMLASSLQVSVLSREFLFLLLLQNSNLSY